MKSFVIDTKHHQPVHNDDELCLLHFLIPLVRHLCIEVHEELIVGPIRDLIASRLEEADQHLLPGHGLQLARELHFIHLLAEELALVSWCSHQNGGRCMESSQACLMLLRSDNARWCNSMTHQSMEAG